MPSRDRWIPLGGAVRLAYLVRTAPHAASIRLHHSHLLPLRVLPPRCIVQRVPGTLVVPGAHSRARGHMGRAGKPRKLWTELARLTRYRSSGASIAAAYPLSSLLSRYSYSFNWKLTPFGMGVE
jgi:hypothetical protein